MKALILSMLILGSLFICIGAIMFTQLRHQPSIIRVLCHPGLWIIVIGVTSVGLAIFWSSMATGAKQDQSREA